MAQIKLNLDETLAALKIGAVSIALNRNPNWRVKGVRFRLGRSGLEGAIVDVVPNDQSSGNNSDRLEPELRSFDR